jgi:crossover junction endodeoxyribonuclease RuvC
MKIVGIDPGVNGAIALLDNEVATVHDMPRDADGIAGAKIYQLLSQWEPLEVYVERTHAMPKNGSKAAYSQGDTNGCLRTAVHILKIPLVWVTPREWMSHYSLFGGGFNDLERKARSRWRAQELFPSLADQLGLAKHHNRAEALLIANYGRKTSITAAVRDG